MLKNVLATAMIAAGVLGLSACDVKKTQEGNVTLPKYEVEKKQSGEVTLPKYDVTTPDVKVGSKEATVTVPKVETQKKTIEVPTVDVKTAKEKEQEQAQKQILARISFASAVNPVDVTGQVGNDPEVMPLAYRLMLGETGYDSLVVFQSAAGLAARGPELVPPAPPGRARAACRPAGTDPGARRSNIGTAATDICRSCAPAGR